MATTEHTSLSAHSEDRELLKKLSSLQDINKQIFELRTLLPEKLINPTRALIEVPGRFAPEKLAAHLKDAAIKGSKDIQHFKQDYHSEAMRDLWQKTNSSEYPQGQDLWTVDYTSLLRSFNDNSAAAVHLTSTGTGADSHQTDVEVFKSFQASNPSIEVKVSDQAEPLPADVTVSGIMFRVTKVADQAESYTIEAAPEQASNALCKSILQQLQSSGKGLPLPDLLSLIGSYDNIKDTPCAICSSVYDKEVEMPVVRDRIETTTGPHQGWRRLHAACSA